MKQFTMDNTNGFTQEQLDAMNQLFEELSVDIALENDSEVKNLCDKIFNKFM